MRLPNSKIKMLIRYTTLTGKYLKLFPHMDWVTATGNNIAEPYHPTSAKLWNSPVIEGIAVVITVCFSAEGFLVYCGCFRASR
jgi:hypothetical protein